ncbi:MAG TPA: transcriptional repressor LexA [Chloroflexia bacterium]|nr:transcriptional repressor LexA [Chloroflexia bacterium]
MKKKRLSDRQRFILSFIGDYLREHGYAPSIREIKGEVERAGLVRTASGNTSTSVVDYNLRALEDGGYIRRDRNKSRAIELVDNNGRSRNRQPMYMIPVAPSPIAAGSPIPVLEDIRMGTATDDQVEVTGDFLGRHATHVDRLYALRVKGTSMIDALINDGDLVILESQETAENGQTVAAWLKAEQEATLKRFYLEDGHVRLQPANSTMQPIFTEPDNIEIKGRVVGVIRRLD